MDYHHPYNFNGWELTIREQRHQIQDLLDDSPSLKPYMPDIFELCWERAIADVRLEYAAATFPDTWSFDGNFDSDMELLLATQCWT